MDFFSKAFTWFADISLKLPQIEFKAFFIVVLCAICGTAFIVALTSLASPCRKLQSASKRVIKYLSDKDSVDDDNVSEFSAQCFSSKTPQSMRDAWVQYLGVRFGYPSEIVSEQNVFDKEVKRQRDVRPSVFIAIALALLGLFAFWGYGTLDSHDMGVIHCVGLIVSAVLFVLLALLSRKQHKSALDAFNEMQEDLDAKVNLQVEKNFAVDSSPIVNIASIIDEIIARNTSKDMSGDIEMPVARLDDELLDENGDALVQETIDELLKDKGKEGAKAETLVRIPAQEKSDEEDETSEQPEEVGEEEVEQIEDISEEQAPQEEQLAEEEPEDIEEPEETPESEPQSEEQNEEEPHDIEEEAPAEEQGEETPVEEEETSEQPEEQDVEPESTQDEAEEPEPDEEQEEVGFEAENSEEPAPAQEEEEPVEEPVKERDEEQETPEESVEEEAPEEESEEEKSEEITAEQGEEQPEETPEEEQLSPEEDGEKQDDAEEQEEKPAKLAKLPAVVDTMLAMTFLPDYFKQNVANLFKTTRSKYESDPRNLEILDNCISRIEASIE